jgi:hypothetical protein
MSTEAGSEEATRTLDEEGDKQVKQANVITLGVGSFTVVPGTTLLSFPYHYALLIGRTPGVPVNFLFVQEGARGTR